MSTFLNQWFFFQTYAISKRINLQWPATSHLDDFLQGFQTVINFLCLRSIVRQKLALQSVLCHSYFYSLVPPYHRLPRKLICLDAIFYGACHSSMPKADSSTINTWAMYSSVFGLNNLFLRIKMLLIQTVLFLIRRTVLLRQMLQTSPNKGSHRHFVWNKPLRWLLG